LLIQQKIDRSDFFNRTWAKFKVGFNDFHGNYWIGNELLSYLTVNNRYKLKFDLQSRNNKNWYYAEYSTFVVEAESSSYALQVSGFSGNASYDAFSYSSGVKFSTYDRDHDKWSSTNCAAITGGGFWHKRCTESDVNSVGDDSLGAHSFGWRGLPGGRELQYSRMWLQCK